MAERLDPPKKHARRGIRGMLHRYRSIPDSDRDDVTLRQFNYYERVCVWRLTDGVSHVHKKILLKLKEAE